MSAPRTTPPPDPWRIVATLALREWRRFARQPMRIAAAVGTALLLWFVIGGGLGGSMQLAGGGRYSAYLVPGVMTLTAIFASIFSSIAVIEDRREGFLQAVLVAPAPRAAIAGGLVLGGATIAWAQALLLLPLAWTSGAPISIANALLAAVALLCTATALQSLGLCFAWRCRDTASFHAVMNLLFMPLWLLSDAFFPVQGAAEPLATIIRANPLSWCGASVRSALLDGTVSASLAASAAFAVLCFAAAVLSVSRSGRMAMGR